MDPVLLGVAGIFCLSGTALIILSLRMPGEASDRDRPVGPRPIEDSPPAIVVGDAPPAIPHASTGAWSTARDAHGGYIWTSRGGERGIASSAFIDEPLGGDWEREIA